MASVPEFDDEDLEALGIGASHVDVRPRAIARSLIRYTKGIESELRDDRVYLARGTARARISDYDGAVLDLTQYLELSPACATAHNNRGYSYYYIREYRQSEQDITAATRLKCDCAVFYCNLGWVYEAIGEIEKAVSSYQQALRLDPRRQAARDNLNLLLKN
jgi:Flp pilus assembly protein TadD